MSVFDNADTAFLHIPSLVSAASIYSNSDSLRRNEILKVYEGSDDYQRALLFYSMLFINPDTWLEFDGFSWIPCIYDEVVILSTFANTLNTLMLGKIDLNIPSLKVKLSL